MTRCSYDEAVFLGRFVTAHRTYLMDAALALALVTLSLISSGTLTGQSNPKLAIQFGSTAAFQRALLIWWLFNLLCVAGLVVQHRWPAAGVLLASAGVSGHLLDPRFSSFPLDLAAPIALYTLTTMARARWVPWVAVVSMSVGGYVLGAIGWALTDLRVYSRTNIKVFPSGVASKTITLRDSLAQALSASAGKAALQIVLVLVLAFVLGNATRTRRAHLATLEQRAADLEREQGQRAALATAAERARITRELHDVVAHGLSVMVVQAQGAAAAQHRHPERTAGALQEIIATGRASLAEMRRLLGVVRREPTEDPQLAPLPGIGALPALVDQVRAAGTPVRLDVDGEPVPLPASVDLSAYRIVQEALTNTLKHAGPGAQAAIRIGFTPEWLEIEVSDDGTGPVAHPGGPAPSTVESGNGLRGIAERVDMLGGQLVVGPCPEKGFKVRAQLPVEPDRVGAIT